MPAEFKCPTHGITVILWRKLSSKRLSADFFRYFQFCQQGPKILGLVKGSGLLWWLLQYLQFLEFLYSTSWMSLQILTNNYSDQYQLVNIDIWSANTSIFKMTTLHKFSYWRSKNPRFCLSVPPPSKLQNNYMFWNISMWGIRFSSSFMLMSSQSNFTEQHGASLQTYKVIYGSMR